MNNTKWIYKSNVTPGSQEELLNTLLLNRLAGLNKDTFLNPIHPSEYYRNEPSFSDVYKGTLESVKIILDTIGKQEKITIYGDYDADGITATAILWRAIHNSLGYKDIEPFIPNRFEEGYGLSKDAIETLTQTGTKLIITVDCGIVSIEEVEYAKKLGLKIIITDHHQKDGAMPNADSIIHTTDATGAGIAWILANELLSTKSLIDQSDRLIGLAAIGTVADLQPLLGFNRSIVHQGLEQLEKEPVVGITKLKYLAGIENVKMDTYHLGWQIGPRLNASGRLGDPINSLRLLCTDSEPQAIKLAKEIDQLNKTRQTQTIDGYEIALKDIDTEFLPPFIITASDKYHDGIIGLIAGKLSQTYNRPALAIAIDPKKQLAKGSGRSPKQIDLITSLRKHRELFESLGGHAMAAGFSIETSKINGLKETLSNDFIGFQYSKDIDIDAELSIDFISSETMNTINKLKPFGMGNQSPIFSISEVNLKNIYTFGTDNGNLKLSIEKNDNSEVLCVGFGLGYMAKLLKAGSKISVAGQLSLNNWNNKETVEIIIKDIKNF